VSVAAIGGVAALVFGIIAVVEARGRNWAGWGVICLAAVLLYGAVK
jgi:hypothetical protein